MLEALNIEQGELLLSVARTAIREALGAEPTRRPLSPMLNEPGATFVTLYRGNVLHGCIGSLEPHTSLGVDVAHNAVAAALHDPRAVPLTLSDVDTLSIEVSLLSPLERMDCKDEASATLALRPHIDGVLLRHGRRQGTFLPQVWESLPDPRAFLTELRLKARLPPSFWAADLELYRYSVQKFTESAR